MAKPYVCTPIEVPWHGIFSQQQFDDTGAYYIYQSATDPEQVVYVTSVFKKMRYAKKFFGKQEYEYRGLVTDFIRKVENKYTGNYY